MKTHGTVREGLTALLLILLLSGCNFPETASEPSLNEQAATFVAMTLNVPSTPTYTRTPLPTPTPAGTGTGTPTLTITPTYSMPMLRVNESTNCRTGPGQSYDILFTFLPGATVEIAGKAPTDNYWVIKLPDGNRTCWLWGEFTTASGSYWAVPTVNPPPTSTASLPAAPGISNWEYLCGYGASGPNATVDLKWSDRADNESGYRIYRNDELVTELAPNSTAYSEVINVEEGKNITYRIEAYNSTGASSSSTISFSCQ